MKTTRIDWIWSSTRKLPAQPGSVEKPGAKGPGNGVSVRYSKEGELTLKQHDYLNEDKGEKNSAKAGRLPS